MKEMEGLNAIGRGNEEATDMEIVMNLVGHINNPYMVDEQGNSARKVYIKEAKNILDKLTNPEAKKRLEDAIAEYSPESSVDTEK
ncbi:MAG: hypothetical protein U0944_02035 [Candidatus Moranbacteria bacterium]|nr:hypothetical protein [Candidatus Moranbacteria bacterium]